jgi:DNA polymerase V
MVDNLVIKTNTSGFASPAEVYVDKRLDINELIIKDVYTTFYFRYSGPKVFGIKQNDVVVVDRSETPNEGDLVVLTENSYFAIREFKGQNNLWGKITWILNKQ